MTWGSTVHRHEARMYYGHLVTIARYNVQITENDTAKFLKVAITICMLK